MHKNKRHSPHSSNFHIPNFFAGKTVALTGGTGFIGLLLVEKLLRSCPDIKKVVVFIRTKHGVNSEERLKKMTELPIYDKLRSLQPNFEEKLVSVPCDLEREDFGLDVGSKNVIQNDVNVFIHSAATIRFNEHLRLSYEINTLAVQRMLKLCRSITNLEAIVHVSTAYSYCNKNIIEEKVYQTEWDFGQLHDAMQWMNDDMITKLTPDILKDRPNTYTLTKAFGEEVIAREGGGLPICIVRPSIVGATYKEPIPGWCANINGPTGMFIAYGKGFLRILHNHEQNSMDIIPADLVVNGIIAAAWQTGTRASYTMNTSPYTEYAFSKKAISCNKVEKNDGLKMIKSDKMMEKGTSVPVYNMVANTGHTITISDICKMVGSSYSSYPLDNAFRCPDINTVSNKYLYRTLAFLVEYLPAYMFDTGLVLLGQKPKLLRLTQRVSSTMNILQYFYTQDWVWKEENSLCLLKKLSRNDRKEFNFDMKSLDWSQYIKHYCMGTRKYILKEDPQGYPAARRHMWRLRLLGYCVQLSLFMVTWRLLVPRSAIAQNLWHLFMSLWFKFLRFFQISSTLHKSNFFSRVGFKISL